jgi:16S rRNA (uracil1498-N3)-methyltransferase
MKTTPRLHVDQPLSGGCDLELGRDQSHYLVSVLRLSNGDAIRVFNGHDGEWLAYITSAARKAHIRCERQTAHVRPPPDIDYLFAPLKHARLDYVVQKAAELGVRRLRPVFTARTIAQRINLDRMRANVIEASEQCNLVYVPEVLEPVHLEAALAAWEAGRSLVFCDERAAIADPIAALKKIGLPAAVLIGPEGGFTGEEKTKLLSLPFVTAISLGPRVMRADTAAVAALTLLQAVLGDWHAET